jgi:hypothetical protein
MGKRGAGAYRLGRAAVRAAEILTLSNFKRVSHELFLASMVVLTKFRETNT